jgi:hypothetical protein
LYYSALRAGRDFLVWRTGAENKMSKRYKSAFPLLAAAALTFLRAPVAHADLDEQIFQHQKAVAMEGAAMTSAANHHYDELVFGEGDNLLSIEARRSDGSVPAIGIDLKAYGEGDYELWLKFIGGDIFYWESVEPGVAKQSWAGGHVLDNLTEDQKKVLIAIVGEVFQDASVQAMPTIHYYGSGFPQMTPVSVKTIEKITDGACKLAATAAGGASKAASEGAMTGRGMGKVPAAGYGAMVALAVGMMVHTACQAATK